MNIINIIRVVVGTLLTITAYQSILIYIRNYLFSNENFSLIIMSYMITISLLVFIVGNLVLLKGSNGMLKTNIIKMSYILFCLINIVIFASVMAYFITVLSVENTLMDNSLENQEFQNKQFKYLLLNISQLIFLFVILRYLRIYVYKERKGT